MVHNKHKYLHTKHWWDGLALAYALVILAALLRIWPLQVLGMKIPWVTFYPAVMITALYGGLYSGIIASILSCLVIYFLWPFFGPLPIIAETADWIGMTVFFLNCMMISGIAEAMLRARLRAFIAKNEADKANKSKSVFLANMSHELRTPLNAILGFTRLTKKSEGATDSIRANMDIVIRSGEHLLNLINNVLDISKIESGTLKLEEKSVDINFLLREVHSLLSIRAEEKGIVCSLSIHPDVPRFVIVDPGKLHQILLNLVGNAIKFTVAGTVKIRANAVRNGTPDALRLRFEVEDTGVGIPSKDHGKIFEPFFQISQQEIKEAGTGLGLAIGRQYAELLGGEILVHSDEGKGSLFYFEIPVRESSDTSELPMVIQGRMTGVVHEINGQKILIVEDEPVNRLLLRNILAPMRYDIREASNGKEGVAIADAWGPDLIFMDIRMPVMNGKDAARLLKSAEKTKNITIVALTAHALEEERQQILAAGCNDVISKPYHENNIYEILAKYLKAQFVFEQSEAEPKKNIFIAQTLDQLPSDLIADLYDAATLLDANACAAVIERIHLINADVAGQLHGLIAEYEFKQILDAITTLRSKGEL
ncbi:MAG: ATP-binding protein [Bacteroidota bacterium]